MKVTVLGATGCVGAATAFALASSTVVDEVVLLGRRRNLLEHHAIDLNTAVRALGVVVRAGTYEDMADSDIVVNAAGVHQDLLGDRTAMFAENVKLIREVAGQIALHCPDAVVINACNPVDALNYAMGRVGSFARGQLLGYALNDTVRFREFVADVKGVEPRQVDAVVIGEHGTTHVRLFSSVRINGQPALFNDEEKAAVKTLYEQYFQRLEGLRAGRSAGWTCAVGITQVVRAIATDSGALLPESVILEGEYGLSGLSMGVPTKIGRKGLEEVLELELAPDEEADLRRSVEQLKVQMQVVDKLLAD